MRVLRGKLPVGMVGLVLVLVLAATGMIYGNWSQSLSINGTVTTATMEAKWVLGNPDCWEDDKDPKGVASTTQSMDAAGKMWISVDNAYPTYGATCYFDLVNNGKLPLELSGLELIAGSGLSACNTVVKGASVALTCEELTVDFQDGGGQINLGQSHTLKIRIDVSKDANPDDKYNFEAYACVQPFGTDQCATKFP